MMLRMWPGNFVRSLDIPEIIECIESISLKRKKGWKKNSQFKDLLRVAQGARIIFRKSDVDLIGKCRHETQVLIYHLFNLIQKKRLLSNDVKRRLEHIVAYAAKLLGHVRVKFSTYKNPTVAILFRRSLQFSGNEGDDYLVSNFKKYPHVFFGNYFEVVRYEKGYFVG